ncbi:anti-repressor SinI family protein [Pseudalkalibacillus caeni]|uniref:DNA-binding anti-repressor SinI n=1 Tax=Exobacillus caeni TaxID=2574798 RepID=A0A5R9F028_9BACL|nr:anti-repressor SinI family protein [Pseudalkalibacillus caeni]TLS35796.1 DNA-binding anti-repressor SinI [Pseudalkalibacillus caeni]
MKVAVPEKLDQEWVYLMKVARDAGLSVEDVRDFIKYHNEGTVK